MDNGQLKVHKTDEKTKLTVGQSNDVKNGPKDQITIKTKNKSNKLNNNKK